MTVAARSILNSKFLNGRFLFALVVIPMGVAMILGMAMADLANRLGVSAMIRFSGGRRLEHVLVRALLLR